MTPTLCYCHHGKERLDKIQELTFAGISRYARLRGWNVIAVHDIKSQTVVAMLETYAPIAGCIIECANDSPAFPLNLFGNIPVVYLHADPLLYSGDSVRISVDHKTVARTVFRELSAGLPAAYAAVGVCSDFHKPFSWSRLRVRFFREIVAENGAPCRVFSDIPASGVCDDRLQKWVSALPFRTAIFAVNDFVATEVASAVRASGRRIPSDITLCGVDNLGELCEKASPSISSVQRDIEREGFVAAKLLDCRRKQQTVFVEPLMVVRRGSTRGSRSGFSYIREAVERIRRDACSGLMARDVVAAAPISSRLFNRRFREVMGHSVHDEIEQVRFESVLSILSSSNIAIGAISDMCGYRTKIALHKAFRQRMGMSMSVWRQRNCREF